MKKKFMTLVLAAIAATGLMASAQTQDNKMYSPRTFTDYAFEGVLLDIPQQQRIDSLQSALRTPAKKKVHGIAMNPDSAKAMPQHRPDKKPRMMNGGAMGVMPGAEYVAKVKEILTPDQFDIFMSNIREMPDNAVNNLLATPRGQQSGGMNGKACKMANEKGQCAKALNQQCDKAGDKKCDKACDKKCDKACDKKCDKACDKKCDDGKCLNSSDNCAKTNCKADKAAKDKAVKAIKDKKSKKAKK